MNNNESATKFSWFISVKVKKHLRIISGVISGKVKKIEAHAKLLFSYKKKRVIQFWRFSCFRAGTSAERIPPLPETK